MPITFDLRSSLLSVLILIAGLAIWHVATFVPDTGTIGVVLSAEEEAALTAKNMAPEDIAFYASQGVAFSSLIRSLPWGCRATRLTQRAVFKHWGSVCQTKTRPLPPARSSRRQHKSGSSFGPQSLTRSMSPERTIWAMVSRLRIPFCVF